MNEYEITLTVKGTKTYSTTHIVAAKDSDTAMLLAEEYLRDYFDELADGGDLAPIAVPVDQMYAEILNDTLEAGVNPKDIDTKGLLAAAQSTYEQMRDRIGTWEVKYLEKDKR